MPSGDEEAGLMEEREGGRLFEEEEGVRIEGKASLDELEVEELGQPCGRGERIAWIFKSALSVSSVSTFIDLGDFIVHVCIHCSSISYSVHNLFDKSFPRLSLDIDFISSPKQLRYHDCFFLSTQISSSLNFFQSH